MSIVPNAWMPSAAIDRVIVHWTGGTHKASEFDRAHYHVLIEANGKLVRGHPVISGNSKTAPAGKRASHTLNCNAGSIGVSLCCMGGNDVRENPFNAGKYPMTRAQWDQLVLVVADLCRTYNITITPKTVLSHAEVQVNLGIKQRQKWDFTRLAFDPTVKGAKACGDLLRKQVKAAMSPIAAVAKLLAEPEVDDEEGGEPDDPVVSDVPATQKVEVTAAEETAAVLSTAEIEAVQKRLKALKYHELGMIDGKWGGRLAAAIAAFKNDRHLSGEPVIDDALKAELDEAEGEGWTRPISVERATGVPEGSRVTDAATKQGWFGGGLSFTAIIAFFSDYFEPVKPYLRPIANFAYDHWQVLLLGAGAFVVYQAARTWYARVQDHREGKTT